jgi:hypothetical protein
MNAPRLRFAVLALLLAPAVLSGCQFMFPAFGNPGDMDPPKLRATYIKGSATLQITRGRDTKVVELREVSPGSQLISVIGGSVAWRSADGWVVQLQAFDPADMGGGAFPGPVSGQLAIQRIDGHEFWTTLDYNAMDRCILTIDELSEDAARGSASCKGLRWIDGIGSGGFGMGGMTGPPYVEGEDPFDAEVTFEATP